MPETSTRSTDLSYMVRGSGPGLLVAHGAGGSIELNWGPMLDRLASEFTVIGADFPGAGRTPLPATPLALDALADGLVGAGLNAGQRVFTVVGFSTSCSVAIRAAVRHPNHVQALVLISGFARADTHLRILADLWERMLEAPPRDLGRFLCFVGLSPRTLSGLDQHQLEEQFDLVGQKLAPGTRAHLDLLRRVDVSDDLAEVRVPTLVIAGSDDYTVLPGNSRMLYERIGGARRLVLESGHLVMAECPERLLAEMQSFVGTH